MFRPEQMSKVSVTGSKRVIDDVIEATYEHHSLHVTDYDGSYEGFDPGVSLEGAEQVNERLVTVRSLESILDVEDADAGPRGVLDDEKLETELVDVRERVNELNDRRDELRGRIRELDDEIDRMEPFAELGIELDLLRGYDSLSVVVGQADPADVEPALENSEAIDAVEVFSGGDTVAIFAHPAEGVDANDAVVQDALVGVDITFLEVPDAETSPNAYVAELEQERAELESKLSAVQSELEDVKTEAEGFLLRAEEQLTIEAQKKEAPLSFATTENAFVAEGWIPTETFDDFEFALADAVGDHAEIEELERATFTPDGNHHSEPAGEAATDGGHAVGTEEPPVVQDNPTIASPFQLLVNAVNRPKYSEFDPTILVFLTFPLMFGFMIGDIGYGILYMLLGYGLWKLYDSPAMVNMGSIAMWAGGFTILFGFVFGVDVFGHHLYPYLGLDWEISKGIAPGASHWALSWLVVSVLFGLLHLNLGYVLSFASNYQHHDLKHALYESASWILLLNGVWLWVFSDWAAGAKPDFLFEAIPIVFGIPFDGLSSIFGTIGIVMVVVGAVLLAIGEPSELAEILSPLVNALSYTRITAVLLAKAGMALAANLLAFGAYIDEGGSWNFIFTSENLTEVPADQLVFAGMTTSPDFPILGLIGGILVAIVGHIIVLLLGITAAGIQGIRLEYVEFFNKFYEGGGKPYDPFGYVRRYTVDE